MKTKPQIDWTHFLTGGGLLYLVLAIACFTGAGMTLSNSAGLHDWAGTSGIVTLSRVAPGIPGSQQRARHLFAYEYRVNGKVYRSDRYDYSSVGGGQSEGVKRYKKGDKVTVYYNPGDPSSATLVKQGPGWSVYLVLICGLAFLLAAIGSLLVRDALALFSSSGRAALLEQLTGRREQAIKRLVRADADDPEALAEALQDPLLRECIEYLADTKQQYSPGMDSSRFRLENAAQHIHQAAGIELETARKMMRALAQRQKIDL